MSSCWGQVPVTSQYQCTSMLWTVTLTWTLSKTPTTLTRMKTFYQLLRPFVRLLNHVGTVYKTSFIGQTSGSPNYDQASIRSQADLHHIPALRISKSRTRIVIDRDSPSWNSSCLEYEVATWNEFVTLHIIFHTYFSQVIARHMPRRLLFPSSDVVGCWNFARLTLIFFRFPVDWRWMNRALCKVSSTLMLLGPISPP